MNELKYQITQILFLVLLGFGAYWAFTHLDDGISYSRDEIVILDDEVRSPDETVNVIDNENILLAGSENTVDDSDTVTPEVNTPETPATEPVTPSSNDDLLSDLQQLVEANIIMESGSSGSRVGTVQEFLNIYFEDRNISVDNDYGPGTTRLVREFQTSELNGGDGRVGPNTLRAMIEWLESN